MTRLRVLTRYGFERAGGAPFLIAIIANDNRCRWVHRVNSVFRSANEFNNSCNLWPRIPLYWVKSKSGVLAKLE
jgi:hypothetical protein